MSIAVNGRGVNSPQDPRSQGAALTHPRPLRPPGLGDTEGMESAEPPPQLVPDQAQARSLPEGREAALGAQQKGEESSGVAVSPHTGAGAAGGAQSTLPAPQDSEVTLLLTARRARKKCHLARSPSRSSGARSVCAARREPGVLGSAPGASTGQKETDWGSLPSARGKTKQQTFYCSQMWS